MWGAWSLQQRVLLEKEVVLGCDAQCSSDSLLHHREAWQLVGVQGLGPPSSASTLPPPPHCWSGF